MNWLTFAVVAWIAIGLELGLRHGLAVGSYGAAPGFAMPLAVFVALAAPGRTAIVAALILGLVVDLASPIPLRNGGVATLAGPNALAFALAAECVLLMRRVMLERRILTLVFLTILASMAAACAVVVINAIRAGYDPIQWHPLQQLGSRCLASLYTGVSALALGLVLIPLSPLFQFEQPHRRTFR